MNSDSKKCLLCGESSADTFFTLSGVPLQDGVLWATRDEALTAPVGDITLEYCTRCGFIWNSSYSAKDVTFSDYDFSLDHSSTYREFTANVAQRLASDYKLMGKTIVEIGAGRGQFLKEICRIASARGVGIDPSAKAERLATELGGDISVIADYFSEKYSDLAAALLVCRHVLDEMHDQVAFVQSIRRSLDGNPDCIVYFEVPNALRTFEGLLVWNIGYAKRAWYTVQSLSNMFQHCGFQVCKVGPCFQGEYLSIESGPVQEGETTVATTEKAGVSIQMLKKFSRHYDYERERWDARLRAMRAKGETMVIWGAGARTFNFLSLNDCRDVVPFVTDIDPGREGAYIPRSGLQIRSPDSLKVAQPDVVLVSNPRYVHEIELQGRAMGLTSRFDVL